MKIRILPLIALLLSGTFSCLYSQSPALTVTSCSKFWKTGVPVPDCQLFVDLHHSCGTSFIALSANPDSSCWQAQCSPDTCTNYACVGMTKEHINQGNGVTVADAVLLAENLLGLRPLPGYLRQAADVNNSKSLSTFDMIGMRELALGIYDNLPDGYVDWIAYADTGLISTVDYCFDWPAVPPVQSIAHDFILVKTGDIDGDAGPDGIYHLPNTSAGALSVPDLQLIPGLDTWAPLRAHIPENVLGIQFGLKIDTNLVQVQQVKNDFSAHSLLGSINHRSPGRLNLLLTKYLDEIPEVLNDDSPFVSLLIHPLVPCKLHEAITLSNEQTPGLWLDNSYQLHPIDTLLDLTSRVANPVSDVLITTPTPNPFREWTAFELALPNSQSLTLEIYNSLGERLFIQNRLLPGGKSRWEVPGTAFPANTVLLYRVSNGVWSVTGKLNHL